MTDEITFDSEGRFTLPYPPPDGWREAVAENVYRRAVEQEAHIFTQKVREFIDGWWDAKFEERPSSSRLAYLLGWDAYSQANDNPGALEEALQVAFGGKGK